MFAVMDENIGGGVPQFATAEYGGDAAKPCKACNQPIRGGYYQVNGAQVCPACAEKIKAQFPVDSHAAFVRSLLFGIGAAILGLVLYVAFAIATGLVIGFVSLAVGYMVGKAMIMGSGGVRGRRYQLAAVLLTYMAVSLSAVPIALSQQMKHRSEHAAQTSQQQIETPQPSAAKALGVLAMLGLASPFLELADPVHGLIGLVILFVGIRIAWQLTAGKQPDILGPLEPRPANAGPAPI
jgi:hypothetical protein